MQQQIRELAKKQDAVILAHFYQTGDIRQVADIVGDSYELAKRARETAHSTIVLCGVRFMAEGAKILNPGKRVLLPSLEAGCPLAEMVTPDDVLELKAKHPKAAVVCYINSSAEVKAVSDVCCTSSSAVRIVKSLPQKEIIFVPDRNLGAYVQSQLPDKRVITHSGFCPIHHQVTVEEVEAARSLMPGAPFLVHPECRPEVQRYADFIGSTAAILDYVDKHDYKSYIIGTELEIENKLREMHKDKSFVTVSSKMRCKQMKKIRLEDVFNALTHGVHEIHMDEPVRLAAEKCLARMIEL